MCHLTFCRIPASRHLANGRIITSDCCPPCQSSPSESPQLPIAGIPLDRSSHGTFQAWSHQADALTLPTRIVFDTSVPFIYVRWRNPSFSFSDVPYFPLLRSFDHFTFPHPSVRLDSRIAGYVGFAIVQLIRPPSIRWQFPSFRNVPLLWPIHSFIPFSQDLVT